MKLMASTRASAGVPWKNASGGYVPTKRLLRLRSSYGTSPSPSPSKS